MEKKDKHQLTAALVRCFFRGFTAGILDAQTTDEKERRDPKSVKRLMLEHYEHIAPAFLDAMFYPVAVMNHSYEQVAAIVAEAQAQHLSMMDLLHRVCAGEPHYTVVVDEYKRNFNALLFGRTPTLDEYFSSLVAPDEPQHGSVDTDQAIRLCVRMVMKSYAAGLRQVSGQSASIRNATLFVLMLDAMNVLLCEAPVHFDDGDDLSAMFMKVCRTQHNFEVMTTEMDSAYTELSEQ